MIEALEQSQQRYELMRAQYESKLSQLGALISKAEEERDAIIANIRGKSKDSEKEVKKVGTGFRFASWLQQILSELSSLLFPFN